MLEWLREYLYPDGIFCKVCQQVTKHHRVKSRPSYSCQRCGHHEHPTAGTIFHRSRTPLRLWFRAIFLMAQTRCGISAKAIERDLGHPQDPWPMFHVIRSLLDEDVTDLDGTVEVDETYIGGKSRHIIHGDRPRAIREAKARKIMVVGMVERGGRVRAMVNPPGPIAGNVVEHVLPSAMVFTDESPVYKRLTGEGYLHRRVNHTAKVYVFGDVHTNTIEGFWSLVKRGISGTYHNVSEKYLQMYLDEFGFRYNHRMDVRPDVPDVPSSGREAVFRLTFRSALSNASRVNESLPAGGVGTLIVRSALPLMTLPEDPAFCRVDRSPISTRLLSRPHRTRTRSLLSGESHTASGSVCRRDIGSCKTRHPSGEQSRHSLDGDTGPLPASPRFLPVG